MRVRENERESERASETGRRTNPAGRLPLLEQMVRGANVGIELVHEFIDGNISAALKALFRNV